MHYITYHQSYGGHTIGTKINLMTIFNCVAYIASNVTVVDYELKIMWIEVF